MEVLQRQLDKMVKPKHGSAWSSGWKKLSKLTKMSNLESQDIGLKCQVQIKPGRLLRGVTRTW